MINPDNFFSVKEQWKKDGFIGGALLCDFLLMKEMGYDLIYDSQRELVHEYQSLMEQRLETGSLRAVLMVNTEIEKCILDEKEGIYGYLYDEIYEHFKENGREYPLQAVGLHIDNIRALILLGESEKAYDYIQIIKEIYRETFEEESYLFCRNWCYILNEVLMVWAPEIAIKEYEDYLGLFEQFLKEEPVLYALCLRAGSLWTNQEQNIAALREAIILCEAWYEGVMSERKQEVWAIIHGMKATYCRNIGEYDSAVSLYENCFECSDDTHYKLFLLAQIATVLQTRWETGELEKFFEKYLNFIEVFSEPEESVAELLNTYGIYHARIGNYIESQVQIEKAIDISKTIFGEEADATVKFKCNKCKILYESGEYNEADREMRRLLEVILKNPERYSGSVSLILNNILAMELEEVNSNMIVQMKNALRSVRIRYDLISNIVIKSNLYCLMMAFGDSYNKEVVELREELQDYFDKYPNSEGALQYLKGEYCKFRREENIPLQYNTLGKIEEIIRKRNLSFVSREYMTCFAIRLKILIYEKEYTMARKWLLSLWETILLPLFKKIVNQKEENARTVCAILRSYMSLFISSVYKYQQLKISDEELYEYILNFKYLEDLFYSRPENFGVFFKDGEWLSAKSLELSHGSLIIECFNYRKYDMENIITFSGNMGNDLEHSVYQLFIGVQRSQILPGFRIKVIDNVSFQDYDQKMCEMNESEEFSQTEKEIRERLRKFLGKKGKIYVCRDILAWQMPITSMRFNEYQYWCEIYQIVYCNTGKDVREDYEIQKFSNSIYFGLSDFNVISHGNKRGIGREFSQLPYAEREIKKLGALTGGEVYLNKEVSARWTEAEKKEIVHLATHTMKGEGGREQALVIGQYGDGKYMLLRSQDIAGQDWRDVKLVVLSACETGEEVQEDSIRSSLRQAVRKAGALFCISTIAEVPDEVTAFFMVCFYKHLLKCRKIADAFFKTQKTMSTITKKMILSDSDYLDIDMDYYLQDYYDESMPFRENGYGASYILSMN